jgi:hypothetical protein
MKLKLLLVVLLLNNFYKTAYCQDIKLFSQNELLGCKFGKKLILKPEFQEILPFAQKWLIARKQSLYELYDLQGQNQNLSFELFEKNDHYLVALNPSQIQVYDAELKPRAKVKNFKFLNKDILQADTLLFLPYQSLQIEQVKLVENGFWVQKDGFEGLIAPDGRILFELNHKSVGLGKIQRFPTWMYISDGLISKPIPSDSLRLFDGKIFAYRNGKSFLLKKLNAKPQTNSEPLYQVFQSNGLKGVKEAKKQEPIIGTYFDEIIVREKYLIFKENGLWGVANYQGEQLFYGLTKPPKPLQEALVFEQNGKFGLLNTDGRLLLKALYDSILTCRNPNFAKVYQNGRFQFIALQNRTLVAFKAYDFEPIDEPDELGMMRFGQNGKQGAALWTGQIAIFPNYAELKAAKNGKLVFRLKTLYGIMNEAEQIVVQPSFDKIGDFLAEHAPAKQSQKWGLINAKGQWTLKNEYDSIIHTNFGNWLVFSKGMQGFWTQDLKSGIPPVYERLLDCGNQLVLAFREGKYKVQTYQNQVVEDDLDFFKIVRECIFLRREP